MAQSKKNNKKKKVKVVWCALPTPFRNASVILCMHVCTVEETGAILRAVNNF